MILTAQKGQRHAKVLVFKTLADVKHTTPTQRGAPTVPAYLHAVPHVVQHAVVNGLADVAHWPLRIGWGDDLVCAGGVLIGSEDANLPASHLLLVDVHRLGEVRALETLSRETRQALL